MEEVSDLSINLFNVSGAYLFINPIYNNQLPIKC